MRHLRAVIADDEPLARKKLRAFLTERSDVQCVGEAKNGLEAVEVVDRLDPDLLFLDIRMPGLSGLEVIERISVSPHIVFTTAFDRFAVTAFELQALDYLLKPFSEDRLDQALGRARQAIGMQKDGELRNRVRDVTDRSGFVSRLFVRKRGQIVPVRIADVELLEAGDEYVTLYSGTDRYFVSVRLRDLEAQLDPAHFVRVHRSYLVNLDHVKALTPYDGARLQVELANGRSVVASRSHSKALRRLAV